MKPLSTFLPFVALVAFASVAHGAIINLSGLAVTTSSTENGGTPASGAFDRDTNVRWSTARNDPQWIYIDLGDVYNLNSLRVDWETASGQDYTIRTFTGSAAPNPDTDLNLWTSVASVVGRGPMAGGGDADGLNGAGGGAGDDTFNFIAGSFGDDAGVGFTSATVGTEAQGRFLLIHGTARATEFGYSIWETELDATLVPEPSQSLLLGLSTSVLVLVYRRRRS